MQGSVNHVYFASEQLLSRWLPFSADDQGKLEWVPTGLHFVGPKVDESIANVKNAETKYVTLPWMLAVILAVPFAAAAALYAYNIPTPPAVAQQDAEYIRGHIIGRFVGLMIGSIAIAVFATWSVRQIGAVAWAEVSYVDEGGTPKRAYFRLSDNLRLHGAPMMTHKTFVERLRGAGDGFQANAGN
jgi:hypothetical protein